MSYRGGKVGYYSSGGGVGAAGEGTQVAVLAIGACAFLGLVTEDRVLFWYIPIGMVVAWLAVGLFASAMIKFADWHVDREDALWESDPDKAALREAKRTLKRERKQEGRWHPATAWTMITMVALLWLVALILGLIVRQIS